ncbi:hypothetical protein LU11_gp152 [Pseudomonas phage Lu11]|uniref:hypothetical protein n=1 Tax=Pseudomonas phage Lu11 TaxID=1161927 RepID=UPI00025F17BD|nr:hypothetical protein LU11_gp152 [Pseudomonas phage Lu11]AFH14683.1 hypothetical protein Lu11_0150 [Pseudomonas phage Lu11]
MKDKIVFASVNRTKKHETFLESVSMEGPGSQPMLLELLKTRNVFTHVRRPGKSLTFYHDPAFTEDELAAIAVPTNKAAIGRIGSRIFIAVPYTRTRLEASLVCSARLLHMLRMPIRLITHASDLSYKADGEEKADPRFKD